MSAIIGTNWLRFDATAEYRAKTRVYAFGQLHRTAAATFGDTYQGNLKSWVFLANAYVDLGTWYCLTPFVGAGIGGAYNTLADFTDINTVTGGLRHRPQPRANGISPGRSMPASPTTSARISRSI